MFSDSFCDSGFVWVPFSHSFDLILTAELKCKLFSGNFSPFIKYSYCLKQSVRHVFISAEAAENDHSAVAEPLITGTQTDTIVRGNIPYNCFMLKMIKNE